MKSGLAKTGPAVTLAMAMCRIDSTCTVDKVSILSLYIIPMISIAAGTCITSDDYVVRDIHYNGNPIQERATVISRIAPTFLRYCPHIKLPSLYIQYIAASGAS